MVLVRVHGVCDTLAEMDLDPEERRQIEATRAACVRVLLVAYEEAGLAGLCGEGRFELAVDRVRSATPEALHELASRERAGHAR